MLDALDVSAITDPAARQIIAVLVQVIEAQAAEIAGLKETVQQLRDENAWLKGEQGKPTIRPRPAAHSSEQERPSPPVRSRLPPFIRHGGGLRYPENPPAAHGESRDRTRPQPRRPAAAFNF